MPEQLPTSEPTTLADPNLAWAHPIVQSGSSPSSARPPNPRTHGWPAILRGEPTLISAPTGSGKTLAAFLVCIDKLLRAAIAGSLAPQTQVVYISPLKALSNDIQKNLDAPLAEIQQLAIARGYLCPEIRTGVRTGDTLTKRPPGDAQASAAHPRHHARVALHPAHRRQVPREPGAASAPSSSTRSTPSPTTSAAPISP